MKRLAAGVALIVFLNVQAAASASEAMSDGPREEHRVKMQVAHMTGSGEDHGSKGDKVFDGRIGPWAAEAHLVDVKAEMAKAKISPKVLDKIKERYHIMLVVTNPVTKKPVEGIKGTVTVMGPDKAEEKINLVVMGGHIGADVTMGTPGKYEFTVEIEGADRKGTAIFSTVK